MFENSNITSENRNKNLFYFHKREDNKTRKG